MQETHRPGHLKQQNKAHKHGRHRSKGEINISHKGKVAHKVISLKTKSKMTKIDRRYAANQLRKKKRDEALLKKRQMGGAVNPPFLVAVVPLGFSPIPEKLMDYVMAADPEAKISCSKEHTFHISVPRWKQRFAFILPQKGNLVAALDVLKVCESVVFLLSAQSIEIIDEASEKMLTCLLAQGMPSTAVALIDTETIPLQKRNAFKSDVQRAISRWLPDEKILTLDKNGDGLTLLRKLGSQKQRTVHQRDCRPHILAEEIEVVKSEETPDMCTVKVSGYVRGQCLSVNGLVHIPGWGDYQMDRIEAPADPHNFSNGDEGSQLMRVEIADPSKQTSLVSENIPDPMDAEQTWPTEEEMEMANANRKKKMVKRVPKGTSAYQACWIPDEPVEADDSDADSGDDEDRDMDMESESEDDRESWEEIEIAPSEAENDQKYDDKIDRMEEEAALEKIKAAREEAAFPDEIDTPKDIPARERFAKYRGLASFRTSPWDIKENLPPEYARIFQFENFERTRKKIFKDLEESGLGFMPGTYVTIYVKNVPVGLAESRAEGDPLVLLGLLPHEHKMSVVNLVVKRSCHSVYSDLAIKSKDSVVVHCGFRRYRARPIYSQHTNGAKHKYERFFQPDATVVASLYAPITYYPASAMLFTENGNSLIAMGRVLSVNPDRLIIKRVVLSGHPFRVLKRSAIIRFMFFNREDIEWFKPVELHTKCGRRGHIKEAIGTHGHMKAVFDDQLKSQDTVLMNLYKRVFPPWSYDPSVPTPSLLYRVISFLPGKDKDVNMES